MNTKLFEVGFQIVLYSNGRSMGYALYNKPTIQILDQYIRKQQGIHLSGIQMVGLSGIQMSFENQTIWHPTSFRPFEYCPSLVFRSPLYVLYKFYGLHLGQESKRAHNNINKSSFTRRVLSIQQYLKYKFPETGLNRLVRETGFNRSCYFAGMCSVFLPDEDRTVNIAADHLQPVQPVRGDKVKVILGKFSLFFYSATMGI